MNRILKLPEDVIAKIAAGEVIERPSYAVKELVENAIDAGADNITVSVEHGGLKKIVISDNGIGMSSEDLQRAILPHTTSKIRTEEDLQRIQTLGFRGEALASIAAVSELRIQTRLSNDPGGTRLTVRNGEVVIEPIGTPPGTIVTVDSLFAQMPARKKFLKSEQTELRHIVDVMTSIALSYPSIHFTLLHNGKEIFDLPGKDTMSKRIQALLGESLLQNTVPLSFDENHIVVTGFIGKPQIATKQNQKQFLFINKRPVTDKIISLAVREAFGTLLPASNTPVFFLNILLPYELVDVNVHPKKEQIHFVNSKQLFDTVKQAVNDTLHEHNISFNLAKFQEEHSVKKGETTSLSGDFFRKSILTPEKMEKNTILKTSPLIQIDRTYIFALNSSGAIFFDQHAVHERILYEEFTTEFLRQKSKKESFVLPHPLSLTFSQSEIITLKEYEPLFRDVGFVFEHFQGNSFMLRNVPIVFKGRSYQKILNDMLSDLLSETEVKSIDIKTERMLKFLSCRAAVKAGDSLTHKQMKDLLKRLEKVKENETCPHGRPTRILYPVEQLHREFKRK